MSNALVSVDWGTTSLRCALVDESGEVRARTHSSKGILNTDGATFDEVLFAEIEPWLREADTGGAKLPIMMSGMIGSRQGWKEAAYLRCPASPADLAQNLRKVATDNSALADCDIRIVPGMDTVANDGRADVMRGEETQVFGALIDAGLTEASFVLPGTHSKWVEVRDGRLAAFATYMTGEIFAALLDATILGRLATGNEHDPAGFAEGVACAQSAADDGAGPGDLLNLVFSARSSVLAGNLGEPAVRSYLSGLLIGSELLSGRTRFASRTTSVHVIADRPLQDRYIEAGAEIGLDMIVVGDDMVATAHHLIAGKAGLI